MGPIPAHPHPEANMVKGNITRINGDATTTRATQVFVNQNLDDGSARLDNAANLGNGRFENGTLRLGSVGETTTSLRGNGADYVEKAASAGGITISFTISKSGVTGEVVGGRGVVYSLSACRGYGVSKWFTQGFGLLNNPAIRVRGISDGTCFSVSPTTRLVSNPEVFQATVTINCCHNEQAWVEVSSSGTTFSEVTFDWSRCLTPSTCADTFNYNWGSGFTTTNTEAALITTEPDPVTCAPPVQVQLSVDTQQDPNILFADGSTTPVELHSTFIRATAKDSSGKAVSGVSLTFSTNFGSFLNGATHASATTDSSGKASVAYFNGVWILGSTDTKDATITVSANGAQQTSTATVYNYRGFTFNDLTITNDQHNNSNDMTQTQIQQFFAQRGSFLALFILSTVSNEGFYDYNYNGRWDPGEPVYDLNGNNVFDGASATERASQTFFNAAQANGINPKVLITTAQKEKQLISRQTLPSRDTLNLAMGCGTASNFASQVRCAAQTFRKHFDAKDVFQGRTVTFPFFVRVTNSASDIFHNTGNEPAGSGVRVAFTIQDASTYAQYRYTNFIQDRGGGGVYLFDVLWRQYSF